MAADELRETGLPVGESIDESEMMLDATREALDINLSFDGIYDVTPGLDALTTNERFVFSPLQLSILGTTIENSLRLHAALSEKAESAELLMDIATGIGLVDRELLTAIRQSVRSGDGYIYDEASKDLAKSRADRKENGDLLQQETEKWAQTLFKQGVCERPIVVFRRSRRCIPVKNGRQGLLPKQDLLFCMPFVKEVGL